MACKPLVIILIYSSNIYSFGSRDWNNTEKEIQSTLVISNSKDSLKHIRHYENMPIQIILKILPPKNENFQIKKSDIFQDSAQNIDCEYSLELPRRGSSNEYPQSMF